MEQRKKIGEEIKSLRIMNNLSVEDIAKKTQISHVFIDQVEKNSFSKLPKFAFSQGLFKNLIETFSLSNQEEEKLMLRFEQDFFADANEPNNTSKQNYNNPSHLEKTNNKDESESETSFFKKNRFYISISVILIISIVILFALWNNLYSKNNQLLERENKIKPAKTFSLYNKTDTFDLEVGDKIKIFSFLGTSEYTLTSISSSFERNRFIEFKNSATGQVTKLFLHLEYFYDLNQDGENDLLIKFQKLSGDIAVTSFTILEQKDEEFDFDKIWNSQTKVKIPLKKDINLIENHFKTPIEIFIKTGFLPVHLSFNIDGQKQNQINLKPRASFSLIAENHITLQIGNYASTKLVINKIPLEWEDGVRNNFSTTKIIKWRPTIFNETKFNLLIKDYNN